MNGLEIKLTYWSEINRAVELLRADEVVGVPTETVYGLAASIFSEKALDKVFRIKNRPYFDPLIVHVKDRVQAKSLVKEWPEVANVLSLHFWPGPLTLVLPKADIISDKITAGLPSLGIRVPKHPFARRIIRELGNPFAAPSANLFGKTSPTRAEHVREEFSKQRVFVVDGGDCEIGIESTVLQIQDENIQILRPGMITEEEIRTVLKNSGIEAEIHKSESQASPGHLKTHYQPRIPLIFHEGDLSLERVKDLLHIPPQSQIFELNLGEDPFECARSLYAHLREASNSHYDYIFVRWTKLQKHSHWDAIRDRLDRAASFKL